MQSKNSDNKQIYDSSNYLNLWLQANGAAAMSSANSGSQSAEQISQISTRLNDELNMISQINTQSIKDQEAAAQISQEAQKPGERTATARKVFGIGMIVVGVLGTVAAIAAAVFTGGGSLALIPELAAALAFVGGVGGAANAGMNAYVSYKSNEILNSEHRFNTSDDNSGESEDLTLKGYQSAAAQAKGEMAQFEADSTASRTNITLLQNQNKQFVDGVESSLENMGAIFDAMKQMAQAV